MEMKIKNSLKVALENEISGKEFYAKVAREADDEFTKSTFSHLAEEEKTHITKIKEFIKNKAASAIEKKIRERNPKGAIGFFEKAEDIYRKDRAASPKFAPYEFAIKMEIHSYGEYRKMFEEAKDKLLKDFLSFLMREEDAHRKLIEESLDFLKSPEDYFLNKERWSFD